MCGRKRERTEAGREGEVASGCELAARCRVLGCRVLGCRVLGCEGVRV